MAEPVQLTVVPQTVRLRPGSRLALRLTVHNAGSAAERYRLAVHGIGADWYDLATPRFALPADSQAPVTLVVHPPDGTAPGSYSLTIVAASEDTPTVAVSVVVTLIVDVAAGLVMDVRPDAIEGRDAIFRVTFVNRMDSPAIVALTVRACDNADALRFYTTPQDAVIVPAQGMRPVMVHVARKGRHGIFGKPHRFAIELQGTQCGHNNPHHPPMVQQVSFTYVPLFAGLALPPALRRQPAWIWLVPLLLIPILLGIALLRPSPAQRTVASPNRSTQTPTPFPPAIMGGPGAHSTPAIAHARPQRAQRRPASPAKGDPTATRTAAPAPRRQAVVHRPRSAAAVSTRQQPLTNTRRPAATRTPRPMQAHAVVATPTSTPKRIAARTPRPPRTSISRRAAAPTPSRSARRAATPTPGHTARLVASARPRHRAHQVRRRRPVHRQLAARRVHQPRRTPGGRSHATVRAHRAPVHAVSPPPHPTRTSITRRAPVHAVSPPPRPPRTSISRRAAAPTPGRSAHRAATPTPGHTARLVASARPRHRAHQVRRRRPVHRQLAARRVHQPRRTPGGRSHATVRVHRAPAHAVSPSPLRSPPRHKPAVKATVHHLQRVTGPPRAGMRAQLDVTWPPDATLHFAHLAVLHLTTMPYASITVTLRAVVEGGGLKSGQPAAQTYRYTAYAQADRHGQAIVPLRFAYIPARPLHGMLTVVARAAHDTVQRSIRIELMRD